MFEGARRSGACVRCCLVAFAVASALYASGPALYWRLKRGVRKGGLSSLPPCLPCLCDCSPPLSLQNIAPGLANLSLPDCGTNEPDLKKEMEKQFVDLLTEELNLREAVAKAQNHHMNNTIAEARRLASQYRREAEKCNVATEACEEARELAQSSLIREKRLTLLWERRARHLGWHGE